MRTPARPLLIALLCLLPAVPAAAHSSGPTIVPVLDEVALEVPDDVVVEVVASQAAPLLNIDNPTDEVLEVRTEDGQAWLRISGDGVEVNPAAPDTYTTTSPEGGSVPLDVRRGEREDSWVQVSTLGRWAWFEHRLHPDGLVAPPGVTASQQEETIGSWSLEVAYGADEGTVEGRIVHRPPTGTVVAQLAGDVPDGITAEVLSGSVPAVFLGLEGAEEVIVLGEDGEPFLRYRADGVEGNRRSPAFSTDTTARGNPPVEDVDPTADPEWERLASTPRFAWLEGRARPALDLPTDVIVASARVQLGEWSIPLLVDGAEASLTGTTTWLPAGESILDEPEGTPIPWVPIAGVGLALALVVLEVRRRRGATG